jgi:hypothetical protein
MQYLDKFFIFEVTESVALNEHSQETHTFFNDLRRAQQYVTRCIEFYDSSLYIVDDEYRCDEQTADNIETFRRAIVRHSTDTPLKLMFTIRRHTVL